MAPRKAFLLRLDPALMDALQRWAADDLRSLNGQIEFLLRQALGESGRLWRAPPGPPGPPGEDGHPGRPGAGDIEPAEQ